ncbi:MAG: polysaccharide pyruvyl transferase family protein [Planctomycetota bacterium]
MVYLEDPRPLLAWIAARCRFAVLSFNDASDPARRARQHWRSDWSLADFEEALEALDLRVLASRDPGVGERVYALACPGDEVPRVEVLAPREKVGPGTPVGGRRPRLALFTSALRGTNSGDALIEDAVRRLLPGCDFERLPLNHAPSDEELARAEACDLGVLCGTNLYQRVFASGLGNRVLDRLDLPLLPLGVGGSAPLDEPIVMDDDGVRAVRRIHERCPRASVRDPESLRFLARIGVTNAVLTGCPVLFHGLAEPRFEAVPEGPLHVSIRARLLHIDAAWQERSLRTLDRLARELRPVLVMQSPFDFAIAHVLAKRYDLELRFDPEMQVGPLVASARTCGATLGYRLHYGMLCLAYGRPARFIGTDTRTASFCELMGLAHLDIRRAGDDEVLRLARAPLEDPRGFVARWRTLAGRLAEVLAANGLPCALDAAAEPVTA